MDEREEGRVPRQDTQGSASGSTKQAERRPESTPRKDRDASPDGRRETRSERADRQWGELLQELRVAQTGVQILFAFLLAVAFQPRFEELGSTDRAIYIITVVLGSATAGALIGTVSFRRLLSGQKLKTRTVIWASKLTMVGLVLLYFTMVSTFLLILRVVTHNWLAILLVTGMATWFALCWFIMPLWVRATARKDPDPDEEDDD
ncbi:DUF6328 family protein [Streptomyces sp. NPDC060194]|uniref:DUF6328 family protein n=1 Tax=Streptomyces sp. NPDC060194 TaxID=3347069 RepID=UPI00364EB1B4